MSWEIKEMLTKTVLAISRSNDLKKFSERERERPQGVLFKKDCRSFIYERAANIRGEYTPP